MSKYFENFQKINYLLPQDGQNREVTNIFNVFKAVEEIYKRATLFYPHTVKEHETPEIISDIYYGTPDYHWIVMEFNKRLDQYFDWPMSNELFGKYIDKKYGSEQYAKQTVKYYYHDISRKRRLVDGSYTPEIKNIINYQIYATLDDPERSLEYIYDWEDRLNEEKRKIKIIDALYIPQILKEKENIFNG